MFKYIIENKTDLSSNDCLRIVNGIVEGYKRDTYTKYGGGLAYPTVQFDNGVVCICDVSAGGTDIFKIYNIEDAKDINKRKKTSKTKKTKKSKKTKK